MPAQCRPAEAARMAAGPLYQYKLENPLQALAESRFI
ncbi:hypothetical protein J2849_000853 [Azospirillum melinis]|nr:hypothetical protein [Azospirillum melinis]